MPYRYTLSDGTAGGVEQGSVSLLNWYYLPGINNNNNTVIAKLLWHLENPNMLTGKTKLI
jgi:hypothetical protein